MLNFTDDFWFGCIVLWLSLSRNIPIPPTYLFHDFMNDNI